jgi:phage terminase small subunit
MSDKKLTPKQDRFCREYVVNLNGTQAAIRAGYSKRTANRIAANLLSKVVICERVARLAAKANEKAEVTSEEILNGLAEIARNGEEKTSDRIKSWELLGKYRTLWTEKHEHEHKGDFNFNMVLHERKTEK